MLAALMLATCLTAAEPAKGVDSDELKNFQGKWQTTTLENGGKKADPKEAASLTLDVSKTRVVTREGIDIKEEAEVSLLDPKSKPGSIDLKITGGADLGKTVKGIYKLEGDTLTVCVNEPGKDRPTGFATKEGSGLTLFVFKKIKP